MLCFLSVVVRHVKPKRLAGPTLSSADSTRVIAVVFHVFCLNMFHDVVLIPIASSTLTTHPDIVLIKHLTQDDGVQGLLKSCKDY